MQGGSDQPGTTSRASMASLYSMKPKPFMSLISMISPVPWVLKWFSTSALVARFTRSSQLCQVSMNIVSSPASSSSTIHKRSTFRQRTEQIRHNISQSKLRSESQQATNPMFMRDQVVHIPFRGRLPRYNRVFETDDESPIVLSVSSLSSCELR